MPATRKDQQTVRDALDAKRPRDIQFILYIPNKGRAKREEDPQIEIEDWSGWVLKAMKVLGDINGGVTADAASEGYWIDTNRQNEEVWEQTVIVYSYIDKKGFYSRLPEISEFIREFGTQTNQGAVFLEFDGTAMEVEPPFN